KTTYVKQKATASKPLLFRWLRDSFVPSSFLFIDLVLGLSSIELIYFDLLVLICCCFFIFADC
ncbi:hypothetical protein, partial [Streptococcus sobrinus]|uniref:hypothetical protein n=1 Tax=Streptococcus sobrinus TaxID=1310 RepID=UPI001E2C2399